MAIFHQLTPMTARQVRNCRIRRLETPRGEAKFLLIGYSVLTLFNTLAVTLTAGRDMALGGGRVFLFKYGDIAFGEGRVSLFL
jgi:hypothetical protein